MSDKKLKILIDTNVAITYLSGREDKYSDECRAIMKYCATGKIIGYIAQHSLSTIWYYTRRLPDYERRGWLSDLCTTLTVAGVSHDGIIEAIKRNDFSDFEDCMIDECAAEIACDYIVTANIDDFTVSYITALTPDDFLKNKMGG